MPLDNFNRAFTRIISIWAIHQEGRTEKRFLKWGRRTKKFEKPWSSVLQYNQAMLCSLQYFTVFTRRFDVVLLQYGLQN